MTAPIFTAWELYLHDVQRRAATHLRIDSGQLIAIICYTPTSLTDLKPEIPVALSELIDQLLLKEPKDRPATAGEVATRLNEITTEGGDKHTIKIVMDSGNVGTSESRLSSDDHEQISKTSHGGIWAMFAMGFNDLYLWCNLWVVKIQWC